MKKLVAGAVACVGILLSVTACSSDEESPSTSAGGGQTQATTSAVTSILTYDSYGCEMLNTASGPQYLTLDGITYCYQQQFGQTYYGYTYSAFVGNGRSFAGLSPAVIRDFSAPANIILMQPQSGPMLWQRMNILTDAVEVTSGSRGRITSSWSHRPRPRNKPSYKLASIRSRPSRHSPSSDQSRSCCSLRATAVTTAAGSFNPLLDAPFWNFYAKRPGGGVSFCKLKYGDVYRGIIIDLTI